MGRGKKNKKGARAPAPATEAAPAPAPATEAAPAPAPTPEQLPATPAVAAAAASPRGTNDAPLPPVACGGCKRWMSKFASDPLWAVFGDAERPGDTYILSGGGGGEGGEGGKGGDGQAAEQAADDDDAGGLWRIATTAEWAATTASAAEEEEEEDGSSSSSSSSSGGGKGGKGGKGGVYSGGALDESSGFLHLSAADTVGGTLERYFNKCGDGDLVLLGLGSAARVGALGGRTLRFEESMGRTMPHLYADAPGELAAVRVDEVQVVHKLRRDHAGTGKFVLPEGCC